MKAILKKVGEPAIVIDPPNVDYDFMNETVDGFVQMIPIGHNGVNAIINEEGMFAGPGGTPLPQNTAGWLGQVLIVAVHHDGYCRSMTDEEIRKGLRYLEVFAHVKHPGGSGFAILSGKEAEDYMLKNFQATRDIWDSL